MRFFSKVTLGRRRARRACKSWNCQLNVLLRARGITDAKQQVLVRQLAHLPQAKHVLMPRTSASQGSLPRATVRPAAALQRPCSGLAGYGRQLAEISGQYDLNAPKGIRTPRRHWRPSQCCGWNTAPATRKASVYMGQHELFYMENLSISSTVMRPSSTSCNGFSDLPMLCSCMAPCT